MPARVELVNGDILETKCNFLMHQCNCISPYALGLAKKIFDKWPETNTYAGRANNGGGMRYESLMEGYRSGTYTIHKIDIGFRIVNMYAQFWPGPALASDTGDERLKVFEQILLKFRGHSLMKESEPMLLPIVFAFPYKIGCGLGGGNWGEYENLIRAFAESLWDECKVLIVKLPE